MTQVFLRPSYPQQGAGAVNRSFGQQLAGQVKVRPGLNGRQRDSWSRGQQSLAGRPGPKLLHGAAVLLVEVEGAAGRPRLYGRSDRPVKRDDRETEGVDQHDGVVEELSLRDERSSLIAEQHFTAATSESTHLDSVQTNNVSNLEDFRMILQFLTEDGAADLLVGLISNLQTGAEVCGKKQKTSGASFTNYTWLSE